MNALGEQPVAVLAVWEPMLPTDWMSPAGFVLRRMSDRRVRQYWDPDHLIARRMAADARAPQPEPDCCERHGILWDLVAVYPADATWTDKMPPAVLINGPVVDVAREIVDTVKAIRSRP
jgi:hypothetical protein